MSYPVSKGFDFMSAVTIPESASPVCDLGIAFSKNTHSITTQWLIPHPQGRKKKDASARDPEFEVIGPYSGALLRNEEELEMSIRSNGSICVLTYLYGTMSQKRTIDAFGRGNVLSLINTATMPDMPSIGENNLASIIFGKNIVMLVATRDIEEGEELFLDYGDSYNPHQLVKEENEH